MAPCASFASFPIPPPLSSSSTSSSPQFSVSTGTSLPAAQLGVSSTRRPPLPDTFDGILNSGVIACLRAQSGEMAMEAARAAIRGGVSVLEIVMTTPGVLEVVRELRRDYPSCIIGVPRHGHLKSIISGNSNNLRDAKQIPIRYPDLVGTVLSPEDARNAVKAGARFLMSPATIKEVFFDLHGGEVLYIPGVMTPTEVLGAYNSGARIVKIYPVSVLGGARYISVLKKPFSHIPMVASQGITLDSIRTCIESGACAVVLSDAIFEKAAMTQRNYDEICRLASLATWQGVQAVQQTKRKIS